MSAVQVTVNPRPSQQNHNDAWWIKMMMGIGIGLIVLETVILLSGHWLTLILGLISGGMGYGLCEWLSQQVAVDSV